MKAAWKVFRWICFVGLVAMLGPIFYFGSLESYEYLTRSEAKARTAAQEMFLKICDREGLDPRSFRGPERSRQNIESDNQLGQYTFVWTRAPEEVLYVHVMYLPYDLPYAFVRLLPRDLAPTSDRDLAVKYPPK